jgi:hypothetical protein
MKKRGRVGGKIGLLAVALSWNQGPVDGKEGIRGVYSIRID